MQMHHNCGKIPYPHFLCPRQFLQTSGIFNLLHSMTQFFRTQWWRHGYFFFICYLRFLSSWHPQVTSDSATMTSYISYDDFKESNANHFGSPLTFVIFSRHPLTFLFSATVRKTSAQLLVNFSWHAEFIYLFPTGESIEL